MNEKLDYLMTDYQAFKRSIEFDEDADIFEERTMGEVVNKIDEFTDKGWYDRHQMLKNLAKGKGGKVEPNIWKNAKEIEGKYGIENLGPYSDFEWGMLNGNLSALRWLIGFEWDMLDT